MDSYEDDVAGDAAEGGRDGGGGEIETAQVTDHHESNDLQKELDHDDESQGKRYYNLPPRLHHPTPAQPLIGRRTHPSHS